MEDTQVPSSVPSSGQKVGTNFDLSWERLKQALNTKSDTDLAHVLGLAQSGVSNAKTRRKIPPAWYITASQLVGVSVDWLLTGKGPMHRGENATATDKATPQPQPPPAPPPPDDEFKMTEMVTMTVEVLESETIYRTALASNIRAFHQAVRSERTLARIEERMTLLEQRMKDLEQENQELKQHKSEQLSQSKAVGA